MTPKLLGLHHVTAISGPASENFRFYTETLGLRMVKKTVNFDDPSTYHLYYGDQSGSPGTLITFFSYSGPPGIPGPGQVSETIYGVPQSRFDELSQSLIEAGLKLNSESIFGSQRLNFKDPHGLPLSLELTPADPPVLGEAEFAGVSLWVKDPGPTREALSVLGFRKAVEEGQRERYHLGSDAAPHYLDLTWTETRRSGSPGPGTVHHLAFQVADFETQEHWRILLKEAGYRVSPVMDRSYFRSIYFREPGGILFEIATNPPGMLIDEKPDQLGSSLRLPPQYEPHRTEIESNLESL